MFHKQTTYRTLCVVLVRRGRGPKVEDRRSGGEGDLETRTNSDLYVAWEHAGMAAEDVVVGTGLN